MSNQLLYSSDNYIKQSTRGKETWCGQVFESETGKVYTRTTHCLHTPSNTPKPQTTERFHKGKNIGKKNETTPQEQAILYISTKVSEKIDGGYRREDDPDVNEKPIALPMLAKKFKSSMYLPVYAQPKLDGVRGVWNGERLVSRKGKFFAGVNLIEKQLEKLPKGLAFDGEIILPSHLGGFQKTISAVKKESELSLQLMFVVYDIAIEDIPFFERLQTIKKVVDSFEGDQIRNISSLSQETHLLEDERSIFEVHSGFVSMGYEGTILRDPEGLYEFNKRSSSLLKLKDFFDEEFLITGITRDARKGVLFICKKNESNVKQSTFVVTPKMTLKERGENFDDVVGKWATIRYYSLTEDFSPKFANLITVRDYE